MSVRSVLLSVFALLSMTHVSLAVADDFSFLKGNYLPFGINFGYTWNDGFAKSDNNTAGPFLGAEISFVRFESSAFWYGAYADFIHQFSDSINRLSFGPEVGFTALGIDGGYVAQFVGGHVQNGIQARILFYAFAGGLYFRGGVLWDEHGNDAQFSEFGVLLKYPSELPSTTNFQ